MSTQSGDRKLFAFEQEAHAKLSEGLKKGAEVVASTLGPTGKNVLIERKFRTPIAVDDGYTAINQLILEDELENLGVSSLVDAANKASEYAGDGTSTTIVLAEAIYRAGRKLVGDNMLSLGKTSLEIKNAILEAKDEVIKKLAKKAKKIETKEDIKNVAYAAYADKKMAETIADLMDKTGENGIIIVEEGWGRETEIELLTGMRFAGKLAHGFFANTSEGGLNLNGFPILVSDFDFVNLNDIFALVQETAKTGEPGLVVVANRYERLAIEQVIKSNVFNTQNRNPYKVYLVKTPSFTPGEFEDLAIYLGTRYFSKERGDKVLDARLEDLGRASGFKISVSGEGIAIGGNGKKENVDKRIEELKQKLAEEKVKMLKGRVEQRIASLASAIGTIKVASPSEGETENIRLKTRNAVRSSQAAVKEGVVQGGGLALKEISDELSEDNILKEPLKAPYEIIKRNSGKEPELADVYDAVKIVRTAVEQACSQAWMLINTSTIIAFQTDRNFNDAAKMVVEKLSGKGRVDKE